MHSWLLTPPLVFVIVFAFCYFISFLFSKLAFHNREKARGTGESYACGEDVEDHSAQPDYSQFFPFAFFFTIAHVATMMVTSIPLESVKTLVLAEVYIIAVVVGLFILLKR